MLLLPDPPPEPEPEPEPEPYVPAGTNPLTGLPIEPEEMAKRPVAVMLNNIKKAQPQIGISQADVIYEVPAEGGITRMLAVYQSLEGVGNLGSIRSARSYYLELALGLDAVYVHAGGSPGAYRDIPAWGVDNLDGVRGDEDAKIFWRDQERRKTKGYEHSLLTSGENIQAYLDMGSLRAEHERGYVYPQAFVPDGTPAGGSLAEAYASHKHDLDIKPWMPRLDAVVLCLYLPGSDDGDGLPLKEVRHPQMVFRMKLPRQAPPWTIVRRAVDLSAK